MRNLPFVTEVVICLGTFVSMNEKGVLGWGTFIRVRVVVNVSLPLKKEVISQVGNNLPLSFPVTYEKLSNFCYACGRIGHLVKECNEYSDVDTNDELELPYGDSLRASLKKPFMSCTGTRSPSKAIGHHNSTSPTIREHASIRPAV
ncbi:hypothetical protein Tsubulata_049816 [Turnera subulata]|uniref:CCHC-type domain-containing protein n=1 Tax=Turnera subulata TaxID=218843 RepID=A0A9Q0G0U4_9ROSI|nr:hypothetical protein Tsubulata_049816 [Turnera subulata]